MSEQKDEQSKARNIYEALAAVMGEVGYVQKTQPERGSRLKFSYAGEADFIAAIRPHFLEQGIVVHPVNVTEMDLEPYTTKNGSVMNRTLVKVTYRFTHTPSETAIDVQVTGEGADTADKSASKAMTIAYKYALRQTLLIETGDDPDKDQDHAPRASRNGRSQAGSNGGDQADDEKTKFWDSLTDVEKEVYQMVGLAESVAKYVDRYENVHAARGAIVKVYPPLKEKAMWPKAKTFEDGKRRVKIFRRIYEYAKMRDAGVEDGEALREAANLTN